MIDLLRKSPILLLVAFVLLLQSAIPQATGQDAANGLAIPATDDGLPGAGPIRRYDWFQKLWVTRRGEWSRQTQQDRGALVFLGDSITQGWGNDMRGSFPGVKVANRGISGDTTRGMLIRLRQDVLNLNPSGVVMLMGTNDLEEGADPETIADNVALILSQFHRHDSAMPVVLCRVFPSSATKKRPSEKIKKVNELYADLVKRFPQVTLLDTWTLFANDEGDAKAEEFPDLLHPNQLGYAKWAAALRPVFATLEFLDKAPVEFEPEPGFELLFNGHDLSGWGYRPNSPEDLEARRRWRESDPNAPPWPRITKPIVFDGKQSSDSRYVAINGRLVVKTPSEGRKIQQLWTTEDFSDDFVLKLEFRATPNADSGVFIRKPQLQCRDYPLAGPYKDLKNYKPQDWNELVITVRGNIAHCTCNGEVLEAELELPESGPIGLEGDRGQMEFRRIRIKRGS